MRATAYAERMSSSVPPSLSCGDCGAPMRLRSGRFGQFWSCSRFPSCRGSLGAHPDGRPVGAPSDTATRAARQRAHAAFDRLWQACAPDNDGGQRLGGNLLSRGRLRGLAYRWLAEQVGVRIEKCHIACFDLEMCERVVLTCEGATAAHIVAWHATTRATNEVVAEPIGSGGVGPEEAPTPTRAERRR